MQPSTVPSSAGSLAMYLAEINRYPLLSAVGKTRYASIYAQMGDAYAPYTLTTPNFCLGGKVAYEYRCYGKKTADLIKKKNFVLRRAVLMFDAAKGFRL